MKKLAIEKDAFPELFDFDTISDIVSTIDIDKAVNIALGEIFDEDMSKLQFLDEVSSTASDLAETLIFEATNKLQILDFSLLTPTGLSNLLTYVLEKSGLQVIIEEKLKQGYDQYTILKQDAEI